jgi:hypothetical protein
LRISLGSGYSVVTRTDGAIVRAGSTWGTIGHFWAVPIVKWMLTAAGALLVDIARLRDIDAAERDAVVEQMLDQRPG